MTGPSIEVLWSTRAWAEAIARLPVSGPLPCRTVLVPRERVAHALRRELIRAGHDAALGGTRFLTPVAAALTVLEAAGIACEPGEEALRSARMLTLLRQGVSLTHFPLELLRGKPGWDEAFAHTISDLETAALRPDALLTAAREHPADTASRLRDIATVWAALDEAAGASWTSARILSEAEIALERAPRLWRVHGRTIAAISTATSGAEARFVRAIPRITLAVIAARPVREHHVARMTALVGSDVGALLAAAPPTRSSGSEREILATYLFESPEILGDSARPRSNGPDGTVDLEEHAGVEAELEATADWVARQVLDGVALEDIAVLMPSPDPLASFVADRLSRLPWHEGPLPVHVAGGLPLAGTAAGARTLAVVRALRAHLSGESLVEVLPALRTTEEDERGRLSHGAASDLVWSLGTAGGNPARPEGALEWAVRAEVRDTEIDTALAEALAVAADDPEQSGLARSAREFQRLLTDLRAARPALSALVGVAQLVLDRQPLQVIWPALRDFLAAWLLEPGAGARVHDLLDRRLSAATKDGACAMLSEDDALRFVEETLLSLRLPAGRFGDPAVYVGTLNGAVGLPFAAVRVMGLAEGHVPPPGREDPVLPDNVRATLGATASPPIAADRALAALHALDRVVRDTTGRVALSVPRRDEDRSDREPSSVILEAAAALGRPDATTGTRTAVIPDAGALERDGFVPARRVITAFRHATPLSAAAWLDSVAAGTNGVLSKWQVAGALDLARVRSLSGAPAPGPLDGLLGDGAGRMPGLHPDRPISPTALKDLLQCPHLFLLGHLLGFDEPSGAPALREIEQPSYGSLVHGVAEAFYRHHGVAFGAREQDLPHWLAVADDVVEERFTAFVGHYPLVGDAVRGQQRERCRRDIHDLLAYDWSDQPQRFVAVERGFGRPAPVELSVGGRSLFVRGRIDRLDVDGDRILVRDLKTGRSHPRRGKEVAPDPVQDIQLAVYGLVAARSADVWGLPAKVAAAYTYVGRGADERAFRNDFHETLEPAALEWLGVAIDLLSGRTFPRTPNADDCRYCRFRAVCGDGVYERAAEVLTATASLDSFRALKGGDDHDEDD
jgi:RecB family exonuclease